MARVVMPTAAAMSATRASGTPATARSTCPWLVSRVHAGRGATVVTVWPPRGCHGTRLGLGEFRVGREVEGGFSGTGISRRSWPWYPVPRGFALLVEGTDEELTQWTTALAARLTGLGVEGEVVELSV